MITKLLIATLLALSLLFSTGGTIAKATSQMNCDYEYKLPQYTVTDKGVKIFLKRMAELNFAVTGVAIDIYTDYIIWFEDNKGCGAVLLSPRTNMIHVVGQREAIEIFKQGLRDGDYNHT